jgi:hypothetical protein
MVLYPQHPNIWGNKFFIEGGSGQHIAVSSMFFYLISYRSSLAQSVPHKMVSLPFFKHKYSHASGILTLLFLFSSTSFPGCLLGLLLHFIRVSSQM